MRGLEEAGVAATVFAEVLGDPEAALAEDGARRAVDARVEMVIGIGGGSVLDVAKAAAGLCARVAVCGIIPTPIRTRAR